MSDSDDAVPMLVSATGNAGAKTGITDFEIQQAAASLEAQGGGRAGRDWKVPVSIVTGFLGSGKSTLVKHILTEQEDKKIAVMVNEFGDSNDIERSMRVADKGEEDEDWIEMSNGCMCCKFKEKAVEALENLVKRRGRFDHIVIETSGLADPSPLISMFWQDLDLESPLTLNGVVTLIDAKHILTYLTTPSLEGDTHQEDQGGFIEATQQIALANSLIINKTDLVPPSVVQSVSEKLRELNPDAPQQSVSFSKVPDLDGILSMKPVQRVPEKTETNVAAPCGEKCKDGSHNHGGAKHTATVGSVTVETQDVFPSKLTIDHLMKKMLWDVHADPKSATKVLRLKALVHVKGTEPYVVQGVGDLYDVDLVPKGTKHLPHTRIVLIGRNLSTPDWDGMITAAIKETQC